MYNVLVFPGCTEIGLEIHSALRDCRNIQLYSAGSDCSNHAPYLFRYHRVIPDVDANDWERHLNDLVDEWHITHIFPAHDDVILALAQIEQLINARVIGSPQKACVITRSKRLTYEHLCGVIRTPKHFSSADEVLQWPIFLKPERGQGSQRTFVAHTPEELAFYTARHQDLLVLENLPGKEYTIDCFSHREQGLLFCGGRVRTRVRAGISMHSEIVNDHPWEEYAKRIMSKLELNGAWFFQMKEDANGQPTLLEVAPRIGGTSALHRMQGINFPLLSIYESDGLPLEVLVAEKRIGATIDRALVNRYSHNIHYDNIYVDLDDTLIINGEVNTRLLVLLHQNRQRGGKNILLTKHQKDVNETLRCHAIARELFFSIVKINSADDKSVHIDDDRAIFVDDSFSERKSVAENCGIPTFDCSMIEMLIDERK